MMNSTPSPAERIMPFFLLIAVIAVAGYVVIVRAGVFQNTTIVSVHSSPAGAVVVINGVTRGISPLTVTDLKPGLNEFRFLLTGYREKSVTAVCVKETTVNASLDKLPTGRISFSTEPTGATVFVNGINWGSTPVEIEISPGKHTVSMQKENYEEYISEVEVEDGKTAQISVGLISSIEYYYKDMILTEPDNLTHYADLLRYYYVKGRYEDYAVLVFEGFEKFYLQRNSEGARRFLQELSNTRTENVELYNTKVFEAIYPKMVEFCKDAMRVRDAIDTLVLDLQQPHLGYRLLLDCLDTRKEKAMFLTHITDTYSKANSLVMKSGINEFRVIASKLIEAETTMDNKTFFKIAFDLSTMAQQRFFFDVVETLSRKALAVWPQDGNRETFNLVQKRLLDSLIKRKKYKEAEEEATNFLKDEQLSEKHRKEFEAYVEAIRQLTKQ